MKDIMQEDDRCVLISGIAGIGKTSLIDQLVLQWADDKVMNDFDFVFKFPCRELNTLISISSWAELVLKTLPHTYEGFFDELMENSGRVLVIIDGIDEFRYLDDVKHLSAGNPRHRLASIVHDIILERNSLLSNGKVIVCGRPQACNKHSRDEKHTKVNRSFWF
ncbi:nucleotide-binding oligomerization domain-containing protein 2-like [Hydractinia symbiolongicarpus]|uniref:nucleotide-binding oligomerization domain-containing protein 2-like n=1 Tax=Hydractinia symbiolongicarpus TaxID=13093 RepID=UPI00254F900A|nr:nucleotide-binding oligomerization domain-containing protein 2-like [Hydractinia symbiolongicarpus]